MTQQSDRLSISNPVPPGSDTPAKAPPISSALSMDWTERSSETDVLEALKQKPAAYQHFRSLNAEWQNRFLEFCTGLKTLPFAYDPFFKKLFHPDIHPDRLSRFLSSLLESEVTVQSVLPSEDRLMDGGSLLIMDILVQLQDDSLANIEIQKIPYTFPAQRASCYSADLLLRQYSRLKGLHGKKFSYYDIKPVYTIVLFEKTTEVFHTIPDHYLHHGKTIFHTGLSLRMLQEYYLIALDVFRKIQYPEHKKPDETGKWESERAAWLGLLTTETIADARLLIARYPWLEEIYKEAAAYRQHPEEVLFMYSEALRELDRNTVQYMIEELEKNVQELQATVTRQNTALSLEKAALAQEKAKSAALEQQLKQFQKLQK